MQRGTAIVGLLLVCATARAQSHCPWLNDATAAGVLNNPVTLEMKSGGPAGTTCTFRYGRGNATLSLQIVVREIDDLGKDPGKTAELYEAQCTSPQVSLRGVGNEAASCAADARRSIGEQVIGRVRNQLFIVPLRAERGNVAAAERESLREKTESVSESVAGALF
jgi:hypothetical protein